MLQKEVSGCGFVSGWREISLCWYLEFSRVLMSAAVQYSQLLMLLKFRASSPFFFWVFVHILSLFTTASCFLEPYLCVFRAIIFWLLWVFFLLGWGLLSAQTLSGSCWSPRCEFLCWAVCEGSVGAQGIFLPCLPCHHQTTPVPRSHPAAWLGLLHPPSCHPSPAAHSAQVQNQSHVLQGHYCLFPFLPGFSARFSTVNFYFSAKLELLYSGALKKRWFFCPPTAPPLHTPFLCMRTQLEMLLLPRHSLPSHLSPVLYCSPRMPEYWDWGCSGRTYVQSLREPLFWADLSWFKLQTK